MPPCGTLTAWPSPPGQPSLTKPETTTKPALHGDTGRFTHRSGGAGGQRAHLAYPSIEYCSRENLGLAPAMAPVF